MIHRLDRKYVCIYKSGHAQECLEPFSRTRYMRMESEALTSFEWNEQKRVANIAKHGIDFEDAAIALQQPRLEFPSDRNGETRILAICPDTDTLIAVAYTTRDTTCRIISARRARKNEQRLYYEHYN